MNGVTERISFMFLLIQFSEKQLLSPQYEPGAMSAIEDTPMVKTCSLPCFGVV